MSNVVVFLGNFFLLLSFSSAILLPQTFIYLYFILIFTVTATFSLSDASYFLFASKELLFFFFSEVSEFVFYITYLSCNFSVTTFFTKRL